MLILSSCLTFVVIYIFLLLQDAYNHYRILLLNQGYSDMSWTDNNLHIISYKEIR